MRKIDGSLGGVKHAAFDLHGIDRINSVGVNDWYQFIRRIDKGIVYEFHRCPTAFIEYCNLIPHFIGEGEVRTFYFPLICRQCKIVTQVLLHANGLADGVPSTNCAKCATPMDHDAPLDDYLVFLGRQTQHPA